MNRIFLILILLVGATAVWAESGVKKRRALPYEYGRVVISNYSKQAGIPPVVFDHWSHRSKYTCRLCHVDIGFSMTANATRIRAGNNSNGIYCGTCHNGKMTLNGSIIFPSCAKEYTREEYKVCSRCHQLETDISQEEKFNWFAKNMPTEKFGNGINWEKAGTDGKIKMIDYIEGLSVKQSPMKIPLDKKIKPALDGMPTIIFSHTKHTVWSGCELCHPEIFPIKKGHTTYGMDDIFDGKFCGTCHKTVAFPTTDCHRCHNAPV